MATLILMIKKKKVKIKQKNNTFFYSHSKAETIVNESDIGDVFK